LKDLSIITVNYRNWDKLSRCLDSLASISESYFSFEVIVVDNCSRDGKLEQFRQNYPQVHFVLNGGNYGVASGNNLGAVNTSGKYLLFLSPETIVSQKALHAMLDQAKVSRANSIISCRHIGEDGKTQKPYGLFPSSFTLTGWTKVLAEFLKLEINPRQNERFIFPDWVSGSVMMMSKTSFNTIGRWNERFWMYYEDIDLCYRAKELNGALFLLKSVAVVRQRNHVSNFDAEIAAVTKTEEIISQHEYISLHVNGIKEVLIHAFLVLNNLLYGLFEALPGLLLFFNKRLQRGTRGYVKLLNYYFHAVLNDSWISPRSLLHPEFYQMENNMNKNLAAIRDENL